MHRSVCALGRKSITPGFMQGESIPRDKHSWGKDVTVTSLTSKKRRKSKVLGEKGKFFLSGLEMRVN